MAVAENGTSNDDLRLRWQALLKEQPNLRIRQAADLLDVTEMALVRARPEQERTALRPDFGELMQAMHSVGPVMILSRNDQVVHEVTGTFGEFTVGTSGTMGLAVGEIDVRVFFRAWAYGFHVHESVRSGQRESLQFFDRFGVAVQKIYRVEQTDGLAWAALVQRFRAVQPPAYEDVGRREPLQRTDPGALDVAALQADWSALKDTHHFNAMLKKHGVDRLTALERIGDSWATRLTSPDPAKPSPLDQLLAQVQASRCPVMFFVGNPGIVQIYTGVVDNPRRMGPWMNVLDKGFNLHANTDGISDWYVVRKPTTDGVVTSLEAFNARGNIVLTLFGERKPGQQELEQWRTEIAQLESALCDS